MTRRLAAILAADIVGYSALMGADQEGTLATLRSLRVEVFGPAVAGHQGKLVKSMGDGWLVEFASAVDAVSCAMQVQDRLAAHERIRLRIAVHIGDVVHEDEDVFGDGVNVAARLEALAEPGMVAITDSVYFSLDGTLKPSFEDIGSHALKNIDREVQVWVRRPLEAALKADGTGPRAATDRAGYPTLAIRPVSTSDGRAEVRELANALTSDFTSYLDGARWLKSMVQDAPTAGSHVLDAVLRARSDRLRLDARLVTPDGDPLWAGKYDGSLADSFDWQDEVSGETAGQTLVALLDHERARLAGKGLDRMTAEECNIAGQMSIELVDRAALAKGLECQAAAFEKDPAFAEACSDAIVFYISASSIGYDDLVELYRKQFGNWLAAAEAFEAVSPMLDLALGLVQFRREGDVTALRRAIRTALRRAPFTNDVVFFCGWGHVWLGEPELAIDCFRKGARALRFSPFAIGARGGLGLALVQAGRDEESIREAKRGLEVTTEFATLYRIIASAAAHLGRMEEAHAALRENKRLLPRDTISDGWRRSAFADTRGTRRYFEGLRLAGMPEGDA